MYFFHAAQVERLVEKRNSPIPLWNGQIFKSLTREPRLFICSFIHPYLLIQLQVFLQ